jgi:hypothetical protein
LTRPRPPGPGLAAARRHAYAQATGPYLFQAIQAARRLGILARLHAAAATAASVAHELHLNGDAVQTLLRALEAGAVVAPADVAAGTWQLTTVGCVWLHDAQVRREADFLGSVCWAGLSALADSVQRGQPAGLAAFGPWPTIYAGLNALPPDVRQIWDAYDHGHSDSAFSAAIALMRAAGVRRILDIGANTGRFACAVLAADPQITMTLLDHPSTVARAAAAVSATGHGARVTTIGQDLLQPEGLPPGHDAVWLSQVLDCFSLTQVQDILIRARRALAPGGSIWILEACPDRAEDAAPVLRQASLYFTTLANGVSRFYDTDEILAAASSSGLICIAQHDGLGSCHTLLRLQPA